MKLFLGSVLLFFCFGQELSAASEKIIVFNISSKDYPPYLMWEDGQPPCGIMVEVMQTITAKCGCTLSVRRIPRKRVDYMLARGTLDATPRAKEWVAAPENYEFSDVIVKVRDVLFSLKSRPFYFNEGHDLAGRRIGTHLGYIYPALQELFKAGHIKRYDSASETAMLQMVLCHRTDAAVMAELVGLWVVKQNNWGGKFTVSEKDIGSYGYRILFTKKWSPFVRRFNEQLFLLKSSGALERIIAKYRLNE